MRSRNSGILRITPITLNRRGCESDKLDSGICVILVIIVSFYKAKSPKLLKSMVLLIFYTYKVLPVYHQ
jgi:hypothetical protein